MQRLNFISIMQAAASSGSFNVTVETINAQANLLQQMVVTGVNLNDSPITIAFNAQAQLTVQLAQYGIAYTGAPQFTSLGIIDPSGSPNFSSQLGLATFRITQSDHVLCFFSEADFILSVSNDTTGCYQYVSDVPLLGTIAQINTFGPISGLVLETVAGAALSTDQIVYLIELASSKLIQILNNNIVVCTYVHEAIGYWQRSFFLREGIPGIYFDGVRVKPSTSVLMYGILVGNSLSMNWNYKRATGELNYIPSQNLIGAYEPSAMGNEIKISYVAGNFHIPRAILSGLMDLMTAILENRGDISELKTGTWSVKFNNNNPLINQIRDDLANFGLWY